MNDIILSTQNGEPVVSSRQIAESFGKEHKHVLDAVKNLVAENSATRDHSAVLRAGSQAAAHPPGCPQFWGDPEHHGDAAGIFFTRVHLRDLTKMLTSTKSQTAQSPQTVTAHV